MACGSRRKLVRQTRYHFGLTASVDRRPDEVSVPELADRLGVKPGVIYYWIEHGTLAARQQCFHSPYWVAIDAAKEGELRELVRTSYRIPKSTDGQPQRRCHEGVQYDTSSEVEFDPALLRDDPEEFERRARSACAACARAVDAELARLAAPPAPAVTRGDDPHADRTPCPPPRPATPRQLRALGAIARRGASSPTTCWPAAASTPGPSRPPRRAG